MIKKLAMFSLMVVLSTTLVFAQGRQRRWGNGTPPDPATMTQMRVNHLTQLLNLTQDPQTKAAAIFTNAATAAQTVHTNLQTARQSLDAAIKKNDAAAIDQAASAIGLATGQLTSIQAKADAAFYAILTTDQQTKYDSMPHRGGPGMMGPMGGRMAPPPPDSSQQ